MLDETARGRLIASAMQLAAERPWRDVTLLDIAERAGLTLAETRREFSDRTAILKAFVRSVDDAMLAKARRPDAGDSARDALFEVVMARLDLLGPYKTAIRSIAGSYEADLGLLAAALSSQHWMLAAAGIERSGGRGALRTLGLASVYASVLRTWLDDEDPGLARTMAALDRSLRRGERSLRAVDGLCEAVEGFGRRVSGMMRSPRTPRSDIAPDTSDSG